MTKILLLDSNSLMNRAFYAIPALTNKNGEFTNAVFGYLSMLSKLLNDLKPTHIAAVFDLKAKTFRHLKYDLYKAQRKPAAPEFIAQFPMLKKALQLMGVCILEKEGYEADDIIGTIAKRFGDETVIVSGDKDVLQLVDASTVVLHTKRGVSDLKTYDLAAMEEEGLTPQQVIEYKALAGDSSDNIPGAKGIGEKSAKRLLERYGDVEGIYRNIEDLKGKEKENLILSKENVELSKFLATINTDVPIECALEDMKIAPFPPTFRDELLRLEFKSLVNRFTYAEGAERSEMLLEVSERSVNLRDAGNLLKGLSAKNEIAIDTSDPLRFSLDGKTEYVAVEERTLFDYAEEESYGEIYALLMRCKAKKLLFQVKDEMHRFAKEGGIIEKNYEDLQLIAYLVNSNNIPKTTEELSAAYGYHGKNTAAYMYHLYQLQKQELREKELENLYSEIEKPLIEVLYDMETAGFRIDPKVLNALGEKYRAELTELTDKIYEAAGEEFNINSNQQLGVILFEKLQLPHAKKTKTGYAVSADVLEKLEHPLVTLLLRYRTLAKLNSTYIDGMRKLLDKTERVHTVFKQALTATGRLSSTEPNLQNIPIREAEGREIRKMFIASEGNVLVSADYSQIELRLLAHFAGDQTLIDAYRNAEDIHRETASKIFNKPLSEVTREERAAAKTVNFGIIYGISSFGLSNNLNISTKKAKEFVDKYFKTYPSVKDYMNSNVAFAEEHGYVRTMLGRIRYFPELRSPNYSVREFGKRAAMNMPLQGTASDIIKLAMLKVSDGLKKAKLKAKLILQVHDELIIDAPKEEAEQVAEILKSGMERAAQLRVPLIAEVSGGENWFEAK